MFAVDGVSEAQLEGATTTVDSLSAAVSRATAGTLEANRQLRQARLIAPFTGTVVAVGAESGETAAPGQPVLVLQGRGAIEVELQVPEALLRGLHAGDAAVIDLPAYGRSGLPGTIRTVAQAAGGPGSLFAVVVRLNEDPELRAGLTAEVLLSVPVHAKVSVPVRAIVDPSGDAAAVYRLHDGHVERVAVLPGALLGDAVSVNDVVEPGDLLVVAGLIGLMDGDAVAVSP